MIILYRSKCYSDKKLQLMVILIFFIIGLISPTFLTETLEPVCDAVNEIFQQ